jgi:transposase
MRALDPEVFDAVWAAVEPSLPIHEDRHPLGCHCRRSSDRECFRLMVVRLVTERSFEDAERL